MLRLKFGGTKGEIEEFSKKHKYHSSLLIEYKKSKILIDYVMLQKYDLKKFIIASIIGRSIRFFSVALTIFLFGDQFIDLLNIIFTSQATFILSAIIIIVILILGIKEIRKI